MKLRVQDKTEAIRLRNLGYTYADIQKEIKVSRGLLSSWFRGLEMSSEQKKLLEKRTSKNRVAGKIRSATTNREKRMERERIAYEDAQNSFELFKNDTFFMLGIALYWAEGGKKVSYFQFINSDPEMLSVLIRWVECYMGYKKEDLRYRLFMHKLYANEECEQYWATKLGLSRAVFQKTIYKPTEHTVKKNPNYKGCLRVGFGGIAELRKVLAWQKLLIMYYR